MPEFILDTAGAIERPVGYKGWGVERALTWRDLDAFTQGYIEALFFTEHAPGVTTEEWQATDDHDGGSLPDDVGFGDLASEALLSILRDCAAFKALAVHVQPLMGEGEYPDEAHAGRDFWYTRNGHGCGFWDGDWPEPHATDLTEAAEEFGEADAYLGDDGRVYVDSAATARVQRAGDALLRALGGLELATDQ